MGVAVRCFWRAFSLSPASYVCHGLLALAFLSSHRPSPEQTSVTSQENVEAMSSVSTKHMGTPYHMTVHAKVTKTWLTRVITSCVREKLE